ncbi:MAG: DUF3467 domain-containing protein [Limnochordia bacterium]
MCKNAGGIAVGEVGFALGRERRYSNSVELNISVYDFVFRFEETCMADDGTVGKHPVVDIVMSPQHAKALFHALNAAVQQYEERFGEIKIEIISGDRSEV